MVLTREVLLDIDVVQIMVIWREYWVEITHRVYEVRFVVFQGGKHMVNWYLMIEDRVGVKHGVMAKLM